jgi:DNA-directed RNA polymerase subunit K
MVELKLDPNKLTKYEKARLIGARSLQISMGAPIMLKMNAKKFEEMHYDPLEIAKQEFVEGVIPIEVIRTVVGQKEEKAEKGKKE